MTIDVQCDSCGARISIENGHLTTRCLFCDAPSVVRRPPEANRVEPLFAIGFTVGREAAAEAVRHWIRRQRMAPFHLKAAAVERITGVYVPAFLYSASAHTCYEVSIAETYSRFGVRKVADSEVSLGSREETEYRDLTGRHVAYVTDILVTASRSLGNDELASIEPFDLGRLRHYSAGIVAGWNAEAPSRSSEECLRLARAEADARVPGVLGRFMPGDGMRGLRHRTEYLEESVDATLLPVWVVAVRHKGSKAPVRILVNGQTGKVAGKVPASAARVAVAVAAGLLLLVVLIVAWRVLAPALPGF